MKIILIVLFCLWSSVCSFFCFKLLLLCFVSCPFSTSLNQDWHENTLKWKSPPGRNVTVANCMTSGLVGDEESFSFFMVEVKIWRPNRSQEAQRVFPMVFPSLNLEKSLHLHYIVQFFFFCTTYPNKAKPTKQNMGKMIVQYSNAKTFFLKSFPCCL